MINLFLNYYKDVNIERQSELISCLVNNVNNQYIDRVFIIANNPLPELIFNLKRSDKLEVIYRDDIPTYEDFFLLMQATNDKDTVSILSNSDITFDDTLKIIKEYDFKNGNECIALTRNDLRDTKRTDTQDVWMFKGYLTEIENCDFTMGIAGCDNSIAYCLKKSGYILRNPAFQINAIHVHKSNIRNYMNGSEVKRMDPIKYPYQLVEIENSL